MVASGVIAGMFVRTKTTPNSPRRSVQICESQRVGDKVKQTIVRHIGIAMDDNELAALLDLAEVIRIKLEAERRATLPLFAPEDLAVKDRSTRRASKKAALPVEAMRLSNLEEETRVVEGIQDIFGALYQELGFDKILPQKSQNHVLLSTVLARVADPQSKHRTAALLEEDFGIRIPLDRIYRMMDTLYARHETVQNTVRQATLQLFKEKIDVVFFDVTTLYFESVEADQLREFGYSKDQKYHVTQVVLALATTAQGLPIGYKLFSGDTAETKTLMACVDDWRTRFEIEKVVFVADMSEANLSGLEGTQADRQNLPAIEYVVGASLRKQKKALKEQILNAKGARLAAFEGECAWVSELSMPGNRRLIVTYSAKRAAKDRKDREKLIDKLTQKLGKAKGKASLKKLVSNKGYLKFTRCEGNVSAVINEKKIEADAQWDGMAGIITNSDKPALELLARYRQLWIIEAAFRVNKHDLKMRPICHWKPERIEAHVAICFLAYALLAHARYRIGLQQESMSVEVMRNELLRVQASILRDKTTGARYRLPSTMTQAAIRIYRAFDLKRSLTPTLIATDT